jgi:hypothetical protein
VSDDVVAGPGPEKQQESKPAGRCLKCAQILALDEAFSRGEEGNGGGPLYHRIGTTRKNEIGEVCGPVAKALLFHVVAHTVLNGHPAVLRRLMPSLQTPEENYAGVVPMWEAAIQQTLRAADEKGHPIVGMKPPNIVVTSWNHVGASL